MYHAQLCRPLATARGCFVAAMAILHLGAVARAQIAEPDPEFDATVARPTYTREHPRVAVDEAHHNYHTMEGRYRPFAQLLTSDGYEVVPSNTTFDASVFSGVNVPLPIFTPDLTSGGRRVWRWCLVKVG